METIDIYAGSAQFVLKGDKQHGNETANPQMGRGQRTVHSLVRNATDNIADLEIQQFNTTNTLLEEHENVQRVPAAKLAECIASLTPISFDVPIKGAEVSPQSNLNVFLAAVARGTMDLLSQDTGIIEFVGEEK